MRTSNCKIIGLFQYKIIIFQGKFSIISAFSIESSEQNRHLDCNLQYGIAPTSSAAVAVAVKTSRIPLYFTEPYPGDTPYRGCQVLSRVIIDLIIACTACVLSQVPLVLAGDGRLSSCMPSASSSAAHHLRFSNKTA